MMPSTAGLGEHWELDSVESTKLGNAWSKALGSLPSKQAKALQAFFGKYVPIITAITTTVIIVRPRMQETRRLALEAQANAEAEAKNNAHT
jgi:hypothetical protein